MNQAQQQLTDDPGAPEPVSATDTLLTAEEVAALLQVTCSWVYAQTRGHRIPHLRLGRYVRYRRSALERWMEEMEHSSTRERLTRIR